MRRRRKASSGCSGPDGSVPDPLSRLGGSTARRLSRLGALARFGFGALRASTTLTAAGRAVSLRVAINQIRFTAVHAVGLVVFLSGILSFLVISQAVRELGRYGATDFIGTLIVIAIVRELGPLIKIGRASCRERV